MQQKKPNIPAYISPFAAGDEDNFFFWKTTKSHPGFLTIICPPKKDSKAETLLSSH